MSGIVLTYYRGFNLAFDTALMSYVCNSFGMDHWVVDQSKMRPIPNSVSSVEDMREQFPEHKFVYMTDYDKFADIESINLEDYEHPENAIYVIGADDGLGYDSPEVEKIADHVYIPASGNLWSFQVAQIVSYMRSIS